MSSHTIFLDNKKLNKFSEAVDDYLPFHHNSKFARKYGFKNTFAQGCLIISFFSKYLGNLYNKKNHIIVSISVQFLKPTYVPARLYLKLKTLHKNKVLGLSEIQLTAYAKEQIVLKGLAVCKLVAKQN